MWNVSFKKIEDYSVKHSNVIELRFSNDNLYTEEIEKALAEVNHLSLIAEYSALEVILTENQSKQHAQILASHGLELSFSLFGGEIKNTVTQGEICWPDETFTEVTSLENIKTLNSLLTLQANFHAKLLPEFCNSAKEINWSKYLSQIAQTISSSDGLFVAVEQNSTIVGCCIGWVENNIAELWELIVLPEFRGKNIGSNLVEHIAFQALALDCNLLQAEVAVGNSAENFYRKLNWSIVNQTWYRVLRK